MWGCAQARRPSLRRRCGPPPARRPCRATSSAIATFCSTSSTATPSACDAPNRRRRLPRPRLAPAPRTARPATTVAGRHQRARDRHHLLLAARKCLGALLEFCGQHREQCADALQRSLRRAWRLRNSCRAPGFRAPSSWRTAAVLRARWQCLRRRTDARARRVRSQRADRIEPDVSGSGRRSTLISVDLPAPFGPTTQTSSPAASLSEISTQRERRPVVHLDGAQLKHARPQEGGHDVGMGHHGGSVRPRQ